MKRFEDGQDVVLNIASVPGYLRVGVARKFIADTHPDGETATLRLDDLGVTDGVWFIHATNPAKDDDQGVLYAILGVYRG